MFEFGTGHGIRRLRTVVAAAASAYVTASAVLLVPTADSQGSAGRQDAAAVDTGSASAGGASQLHIEVPPFHGLEPRLELSYQASAGDGWLGVGWSLTGISTIVREGPGGGLRLSTRTTITT